MRVNLRYGCDGLAAEVPDGVTASVLRMRRMPVVTDPAEAVRRALTEPIGAPPLAELARGRRDAAITTSDITRPVPNAAILPPLLDALNAAGIPDERIVVIIGTGLHRPNTEAELRGMLGPVVLARCRVVNHIARDESTLVHLGETPRGTPIWVNRRFVEADLHIAISLIEPHLMAGFSGGRKAICPGLAGARTMRVMHGPALLGHEAAREGVLDGNPFHEESTEIARRARVDFIVNVALDEARQVTGIFAGGLVEAHLAGCRFVADQCTAWLDAPADVVLTTSAGYPLDLTFYQSVKAMTAALPALKDGGTIIVAAACAEGIGSAEFRRLMAETTSPAQFRERLRDPDFFIIDQWQLQEMCKALDRAEILYYSDGIGEDVLHSLLVTPVRSIEDALDRALARHSRAARIAVIPEGPYVMPRLRE